MIRSSVLALVVTGLLSSATWAGSDSARIVTRQSMYNGVVGNGGSPYQGVPGVRTYEVDGIGQRDVFIIERQIVAPAAVVSRELSQQPVRPHLVEVLVVNTTIYIDPRANYIQNGRFRVNHNGIIPSAQRLWNSTHALPARIIVAPRNSEAPAADVATIRPILMIPKEQLKKMLIPQVPKAPLKKDKSMAMAD